MMNVMAKEKIRLVIQTDEELRAALRLQAAKEGVEMSELADTVLREYLAKALEEVRARTKRKREG